MNRSLSTVLPVPAFAELLWQGDPDQGRAVFNNLNFEGAERHSPGTGSILPATDPLHGKIWRVHKPAADNLADLRIGTDLAPVMPVPLAHPTKP